MRILIAYAGKTGTSQGAAELLASLLPRHDVTVADLAAASPDPAAYDYAVVGGAVRMGRGHRALRAFLRERGTALARVPHTLFLCCANAPYVAHYFEKIFPRTVRESAESCEYFGGVLDPARQRGIDRLLVRIMRSTIRDSEDPDAALPGFLPKHVRLLADRLRPR